MNITSHLLVMRLELVSLKQFVWFSVTLCESSTDHFYILQCMHWWKSCKPV